MDHARSGLRTSPLVLFASGTVLALLLLTPSPSGGAPSPFRPTIARPTTGTPYLDVDPTSWWMPAGNSTEFVATWADAAPNCTVDPQWYRWSIQRGSTEGTLAGTNTTNVTFFANSVESGSTTLEVRAAIVLACGTTSSAVVENATANVTVVAPITLENLSLAPSPVPAGGIASLEGNVSGGEPPYTFRVAWGEGNVSSAGIPTPGAFRVPHAFPSGQYSPSVVVTDSAGLVARGTVDSALTANDSLAVGLAAANSEIDVGLPARFSATVLGEPNGSATGWSCSSIPSARPLQLAGSTNFSCAFSETGSGSVFFEVLPPFPQVPESATLLESVVPLPTIRVETPNVTSEVGQPCAVGFNVTGGVPPLRLDWYEIGTSVEGSVTIAADGRVLVPLDPAEPGSLQLVTRLVDADGAVTSNATTRFVVDPALNDSIVPGRALTTWGAALALSGSVTSGEPPYLWAVTPGSSPSNETPPAGTLDSVGSFEWQGGYSMEGGTTLTVTIVDAAGAFTISPCPIEAVVPLSGRLAVDSDGPPRAGSFELNLSLAGGLPPFAISVAAEGGSTWNRTALSDGSNEWTFTVTHGGALWVMVAVVDALGVGRQWTTTIDVTAPPLSNASSPPLAIAPPPIVAIAAIGGGLVASILVTVYLLLRRRRATPVPPPAPEPVAILRGIIQPADGADRATVELLAEEAGVRLEVAQATVDRLIADGTILSETDPDGGEVLSWATLSAP